ncbi:MAG: chromate resistance protein [Candidatus Competibacteraceae bacterium]|nr:chromate resistance protein [Candidatus Competibacteraceae bacterium]
MRLPLADQTFYRPNRHLPFLSSGVRIDQGIAFDTPDAPFRRTHNQSTFERLLDHYAFRNPTLLDLGRLLHDIEINTGAHPARDRPALEGFGALVR